MSTLPLQETANISFTVDESFLMANDDVYERLVAKIQVMDIRKETEIILGGVTSAAQVAERFHTGRFSDGAIENLALEIGAQLDKLVTEKGILTLPVAREDHRRRVLHVIPVFAIGGHMPLLYHWMRNDRNSCHSVILMNHQGDVPSQLSEAVRSSGGDLVILPSNSRIGQKALWLREVARRSADLVVWHVIGPDVVPMVAFATHECPPVVLVDHADHLFWLGSSVADIVINLRTAGSKHALERRFASRSTVIPIPLLDRQGNISRCDARQLLGIEKDQVVLLSVGRAIKYRPCGIYDFVATANKILDRQLDAHLYVVGESAAGIAPYLRCALHDRLHFIGSVEDPWLYCAAADIYLESFPYGSQTALLEAALSGLPVVPAYAPLFPLLVANDDSIKDILPNPKDEQEYMETVELLIRNSKQRFVLGRALRDRLLIDHVGEGWLNHLAALYQETDILTHRPRPIPVSSCNTSEADISLSLWDVMADSKNSTFISENFEGAVLRHKAFVAKYVGDFTIARRFAWRAVQQDPYQWLSWRLLAVTYLGRTGRLIRRYFNVLKGTLSKNGLFRFL